MTFNCFGQFYVTISWNDSWTRTEKHWKEKCHLNTFVGQYASSPRHFPCQYTEWHASLLLVIFMTFKTACEYLVSLISNSQSSWQSISEEYVSIQIACHLFDVNALLGSICVLNVTSQLCSCYTQIGIAFYYGFAVNVVSMSNYHKCFLGGEFTLGFSISAQSIHPWCR